MNAATARILRDLSAAYIRDRRASGDLRSKLVAVAHERSRMDATVAPSIAHERSEVREAEIERVRRSLERSSRAADERLRAMESVIAAVVRAVAERPVPTASPARDQPAARPIPAGRRTVARDPVRGGWSAPGA